MEIINGGDLMLCVCGASCVGCPRYQVDCQGCEAIEGKVYWAQYIGNEVCPIFSCARVKNHQTCGVCPNVPCELWHMLKDTDMSDEEHEESIKKRVQAFKTER